MAEGKEGEKSKTAGTTSQRAEPPSAIGGAIEAAQVAAKDVGGAIAGLAGQAKDQAQGLATAAGDAVGQATRRAREWGSAACESSQSFGKDVCNLMSRYPIPTVLVGLGVGFLLATVTRPRT